MEILQLAGAIIVFIGSVFLFLGGLGLLRMPDVYNRIQAGTKATTLGSMCVFIGLGIYHPAFLPRMLVLLAFIVITNPVSSHALARAAHFAGVRLAKGSVCDVLAAEETDDVGSSGTDTIGNGSENDHDRTDIIGGDPV
jgi:multicomponent Na+:H+ antiporter subunit G